MTAATHRRLFRIALVLSLAGAAPAALAQNFSVTLSPSAPPIANAATQGVASSVSFDVTNGRPGTTINQIDFTYPKFWPATGGVGPPGWALVSVSEHANNTTVSFAVATCGQGGLGSGSTGTFRLDFTPSTSLDVDGTVAFDSITPQDPCGGTSGWTSLRPDIPVKVLELTASASPLAGASPLASTVRLTVTNHTFGSLTVVAPTPTISPAADVTTTGCSPPSLSLAGRDFGTFTCGYVFSPPSSASYTVATTVASSPVGASAVGAVAGPILVGSGTATFAFDHLFAARGDVVRATLSVTNRSGATDTITPPGYAQLSLTNLSPAAGTTDPAPAANVPTGESRSFVYALTVTGAPGTSYVAAGTATVGGGSSNLAVTPAGTVSAFTTTWTPTARKAGAPAPYRFKVTVENLSTTSIGGIDVVNPQNTIFTGLRSVSFSGMTAVSKTTSGSTDTLKYTGALAQNATATLTFEFTTIPAPGTTTTYPFQVQVFGLLSGGGTTFFPIGTRDVSVAIAVPLPDVADLSLLSSPTGQTLYWTNTSSANGTHDGVVIFRSAVPVVPTVPVDGTDYTGSPSVFYFDKFASSVSSRNDPEPGAFNYRVCNHDAGFIYSACTMTTWQGAVGYIDSVALPSGVSWAHSFRLPIDGYPGMWQGRIAVASNAPSLAVVAASNGQRPFAPVRLSGLPNVGTPAAPVDLGASSLAFGADSSGGVFAVDLAAGATPPGWKASKAGEGFVGGIAGVLEQYVGSAYRASYSTDVLLLGSSFTGNLVGIDARTGATLWTKPPATGGATIVTQPHYDYATNRLYVAYDNGGGVVAYGGIGSGAAPGTPLWSTGGSYVTPCTFGNAAGQVACVESDGKLHVLDGTTGADLLGASGYPTGVANAVSLWPVRDGYVVSNASTIQRLVVSGASVTATYAYGGTSLSPLLVSVGDGFVYVAASDRRLHKLLLSNLTDTGLSRTLPVAGGTSATLATPAMDVVDGLLLIGSSDGRLWAVPVF